MLIDVVSMKLVVIVVPDMNIAMLINDAFATLTGLSSYAVHTCYDRAGVLS